MNATSELLGTPQNSINRTETGQKTALSGFTKTRLPKTHQDFWRARLKKRTYRTDGKLVEIPTWQVRLFHQNREEWFNLDTANKEVAAIKARDIYGDLKALGWEQALAKHKPRAPHREELTIEEFADLYRETLQKVEYPPTKQTAERYLKSLVFICGRVRVNRIANLTTEKVKLFVGDYLADGRKEGRDGESVKVSCNAVLRNAAALFSKQMLAEYQSAGLALVNPFIGQKLRRIQIKAYSPLRRELLDKIWQDASRLRDGDTEAQAPVKQARKAGEKRKRWTEPDFRNPQPGPYILLLLELGLGLRRHEADKAQWDWFFSDANGRHYIEVKATPYFTPKSKESRVIPVEQVLFDAIEATRNQVSPFIVPGRLPKRYDQTNTPKNLVYRCDQHHRTLAYWLRQRGITDDKPCHLLRKEFGSYVATAFGLFHAQRMLGHSSPAVTEAFYAGLTQMPELKHAKVSA